MHPNWALGTGCMPAFQVCLSKVSKVTDLKKPQLLALVCWVKLVKSLISKCPTSLLWTHAYLPHLVK